MAIHHEGRVEALYEQTSWVEPVGEVPKSVLEGVSPESLKGRRIRKWYRILKRIDAPGDDWETRACEMALDWIHSRPHRHLALVNMLHNEDAPIFKRERR